MTLIEAAKQALEALEHEELYKKKTEKAITALRTAIAEAEKQEPVAWMDEFGNVFPLGAQRGPKYLNEPMKPLYTTSPAAQPCPTCEALARTVMMDQTAHDTQRQPLTDEQIDAVCAPLGFAQMSPREVARAIEAAHNITGEKK